MDRVHKQSYGFSCGPAALLSVIHGIDPSIPLEHDVELDLWSDANLGESRATSAHGLALAALRMGFKARILASGEGIGFDRRLMEHSPSIRPELLHALFDHTRRRALSLGLIEEIAPVTLDIIGSHIGSGHLPIVLISTSLMGEDPGIPHWVVVVDVDDGISIANPETGGIENHSIQEFSNSFGYDGYSACILIWKEE